MTEEHWKDRLMRLARAIQELVLELDLNRDLFLERPEAQTQVRDAFSQIEALVAPHAGREVWHYQLSPAWAEIRDMGGRCARHEAVEPEALWAAAKISIPDIIQLLRSDPRDA